MPAARLRGHLARIAAAVLVLAALAVARLPETSASERERMASRFSFTAMRIAEPSGFPMQHIRQVNPEYRRIQAWISSVGASVAMNDLDGDRLSNDLCYVDTRIDQAVVAPAPVRGADRYRAFALSPAPLPYDRSTMAPMGCLPGDFNEDGRMDLAVYYWGRTPVLFLARGDGAPSPALYRPAELVPVASPDGRYHGPRWFSNAGVTADVDGDGHGDLYIGNYFPDGSRVLEANAPGDVTMQHSMSRAYNGGDDHLFLGSARGGRAGPAFTEARGVLPRDVSRGWTLATGAADLDSDLLPEIYIGNDFGPDRLLHNESTPGHVRFRLVQGRRGPGTPSSKALGRDSFKGMGVDFADENGDGALDMWVSNITTPYALLESNFLFVSNSGDPATIHRDLERGAAPWTDRSESLGVSRSGWGWDSRMADFDNDGTVEVMQALGFVKGSTNRWADLQELAMANDELIANPLNWPRFQAGTDLAGHQHTPFFVRGSGGRYVDLSQEVGLDVPAVTRGIAIGDADGDGAQDFTAARQWEAPAFYHNDRARRDAVLGLRLLRAAGGRASGVGGPAIGAQVIVTGPDGRRHVGYVDGGSGHSGKRSPDVVIGLGERPDQPLRVQLRWRDGNGKAHQTTARLKAGWHDIRLGAAAQEVTSR